MMKSQHKRQLITINQILVHSLRAKRAKLVCCNNRCRSLFSFFHIRSRKFDQSRLNDRRSIKFHRSLIHHDLLQNSIVQSKVIHRETAS